MFVITAILMLVLAGAVLAAGGSKVAKVPAMQQAATHLGFSMQTYQGIGGVEVLAGLGLLLGLFVSWLGVLTALCLVVFFGLAVGAHVRKGDGPQAFGPAAGLAVLSLIVLILRIAT